ncbi:low molecular weight phosphotyrosine protein phosphatase [Campylobacter vulpis]|uniref:protein-tyrosine-phosphatase n=1 Tax=Campylobacter vulpis TaxID=1655500 RepID=A0A2G4R3D4_9BACT|nr:low molecular weight protein-tyrosine-phosphatase [Campylobacter vulpis]MBS4240344.1 low molecular weight phosphotyrosine protein phosphatase [Campylobacter vulpis]MBS4251847.1 low molecular weight phosphotyrosine protein phosphatase [Campylobacter vulpis]MBS4281218.1 low molecular weight phosphotyrosine protein phosphatase [Campylobacter vulpis]MBS4331057.1 low molecular weight phosphotyrosine protein phosphatase [Campylobacter vulpis]MBS4406939.1 low molecular weight phosphotyrosine prote
MKKIIFVCLGNICRSPMAEFVMKDLLEKEGMKGEFEITSAGTSGEHNGESMHQGTKNKLNAKNIKAKNFISKKLTQKMCDESEMIIVMDNMNLQNVKCFYQNVELKLKKMTDFAKDLGYDEVPDPWYSGDFDETYHIVLHACRNLIKEL